MSGDDMPTTIVICCSVLHTEVDSLRKVYWPYLTFRFLSSMLHMNPEHLAVQLDSLVGGELIQGHRVVLIYGDCCEKMEAIETRPGVVRTRGINCCDLLLGRQEYRRLSQEGSYFLLPEWTSRWQEIFTTELGLNRDNATGLMQDLHRKLVYLDTGVVPVPESDLQACSLYSGLPYEVYTISLEHLRTAIEGALLQL